MGPVVRWRECAYALAAALVLFPADAHALDRQVRAGDDLQAILDAAQPGDVLLLESGVTFRGNFVLGVKPGAGYITIRSATADALLPQAGNRMTPGWAGLLAKLESPNTMPSLRTAPGAHHWRVMLLEFGANQLGYGEIVRLGETGALQTALSQVPYEIEFDRVYIHGHPLYGQKRGIALNARSVKIRNCWISDIKTVGFDAQAIGGWNGPGQFVIENNYLEASGENVLFGGADPSIPGLVTEDVTFRYNLVSRPMSWRNPIIPMPLNVTATASSGSLPSGTYAYRIVARRPVGGGTTGRSDVTAEARVSIPGGGVRLSWIGVPDATEYVVYGRVPGALDMSWTVTGTTFTDNGTAGTAGAAPTGPGSVWQVKNLFELKNARRVTVEYNIFENNWMAAQAGYAILFTVRNQDGTCTWCVVSDVVFQFNILRNSAGGINVLGYDSPNVSAQTNNLRIRHNLVYGLTTLLGGTGWFLLIGDEPRDVVVDHNTVDSDGTTVVYAYGGTATAPRAIRGFQFTNNAARHGTYGINGASFSPGTTTLAAYFPGAVVLRNWLPGGDPSRYPAGNYFSGDFAAGFVAVSSADYRQAPGSLLIGAATDGTNIGADVTTLMTAVAGVAAGAPPGPRAPGAIRVLTR